MAATKSLEILETIAIKITPKDEEMLKKIARTAMTGKSVGGQRDFLAGLSVRAVKAIAEEKNGRFEVDVENIKVEKKAGGSISDTSMIEGVVIDKERVHPRMPKTVKDAKIALVTGSMEIAKTQVEAKIQIRDPQAMQRFLDEEEGTLRKMADRLKEIGATVVFCQKGIDDLVQHYLAKHNIYACRRLKESDMEKIAKASGAKMISNVMDIEKGDLGGSAMVEEKKIGDDNLTYITGCKNPKAISIMIRGGTEHVIEEVERALHDALRVVGITVEDGKAVPGGGAPEIELSLRLANYASSVGGREQLAIEAFAQAMEVVPWALAENAGLDAMDVVIKLKSAHEGKKANKNAGLNLVNGEPIDMLKENVIEPLRVKTQAVKSATEVANMILRIDDVIASRKAPPMPPGGAGGGMPPGMPPGMMG